MPTGEEQIIEQAAEDFEKEFHVRVKLFAKVYRKEIGDKVQIKQRGNIYGDCLRQSGWFMYDNQEEPQCAFRTKPSDPYQTFAVYDVQNRRWTIRWFSPLKGVRTRVSTHHPNGEVSTTGR